MPLPQKSHCNINILWLLFPEWNIVFISSVTAGSEIKAGEPYFSRQVMELWIALIPTGRVAMKVEYYIASARLSIEGERKWYVKDWVLKVVFVFAFWVDDLMVVSESWWTNEHEAVLFDEAARNVLFDLVSPWLFRFFLTFLHLKQN